MPSLRLTAATVVTFLLMLACTGEVPRGRGATTTPGAGDGTSATGPGATGAPTAGTRAMGAPASGLQRTPLRRLSAWQYVRSVEGIFDLDQGSLEKLVPLLPVVTIKGAYDTEGDAQAITEDTVQAFYSVAALIADEIISDPALRLRAFPCEALNADCVRGHIAAKGRRAFRRPLEPREQEELMALFASESDAAEGLRLLVQALTTAPSFLYRIESGQAAGKAKAPLTDYEVATRLALLFTGRGPSDALLDVAAAGQLREPSMVRAQAGQLLEAGLVESAFQPWLEQWLYLRGTNKPNLNPALVPEYTSELAADMRTEVLRMFGHHMWRDVPFMEVFRTRTHHVTSRLAPIYGISGPAAGDVAPVEFSANDENRGGFFTTAAFAMITSTSENTSLIHRGVYVREHILCEKLPVPQVIPVGEPSDTLSRADNPDCAGCHRRIDPIGQGLERYDVVGRVRAVYPHNGQPVPLEGVVDGLEQPNFRGGVGLGERIATSSIARACVLSHLLRWTLGRSLSQAETVHRDAYLVAFDGSGGSFRELLLDIVSSEAFLMYVPE